MKSLVHNIKGAVVRKAPVRLAGLLAIVLLSSGCFSYRSMRALQRSSWPDEPRAIIPVRAGDVRLTIREGTGNTEEIAASDSSVSGQADAAEGINAVLDTLSKGKGNPLCGPSRLVRQAGDADWLECLRVYLDDPGPPDEPWKCKGRLEVVERIGYGRVLVVRPTIEFDAGREGFVKNSVQYDWHGRIVIEVDDVDLQSGLTVASGTGDVPFSGHAGIIGIGGGPSPYAVVVPYGWGKTFGRAVDQAARQAFAGLFGPPAEEKAGE